MPNAVGAISWGFSAIVIISAIIEIVVIVAIYKIQVVRAPVKKVVISTINKVSIIVPAMVIIIIRTIMMVIIIVPIMVIMAACLGGGTMAMGMTSLWAWISGTILRAYVSVLRTITLRSWIPML